MYVGCFVENCICLEYVHVHVHVHVFCRFIFKKQLRELHVVHFVRLYTGTCWLLYSMLNFLELPPSIENSAEQVSV